MSWVFFGNFWVSTPFIAITKHILIFFFLGGPIVSSGTSQQEREIADVSEGLLDFNSGQTWEKTKWIWNRFETGQEIQPPAGQNRDKCTTKQRVKAGSWLWMTESEFRPKSLYKHMAMLANCSSQLLSHSSNWTEAFLGQRRKGKSHPKGLLAVMAAKGCSTK